MKTSHVILIVTAIVFAGASASRVRAAEENWPQFLGPGSRAVSDNADLPDRWSATENVAWKRDIPGRGWSSPIAWGDRVFLTTVVEVGKEAEPPQKGFFMAGPLSADATYRWEVLCLDLASGKVLWERTAHESKPFRPTHAKNSFASETPTTDGQRVYAYFGNVGVFCFDFKGNSLWQRKIEPHRMRFDWGTAASPILYGDRLYILNDNEEDSYLLALDKLSGEKVWRVARDEKSNWSTPFAWKNDRRAEIVTVGSGKVRSYGLDGKLLWWFNGKMSGITVATPYADGGLAYVSSGFLRDKSRPVYAIRPGGSGDVAPAPGQSSNAAIAWSKPVAAPYVPTTLVYQGRLYVLYDTGTMSAFNSQTGAALFERQKLPGGSHFTSSPWANNGQVFCIDEDGVAYVVRAGDKFELLRKNPLADDDGCLATPAMVGDRLLIRSVSRVYCVRKTASGETKAGG